MRSALTESRLEWKEKLRTYQWKKVKQESNWIQNTFAGCVYEEGKMKWLLGLKYEEKHSTQKD